MAGGCMGPEAVQAAAQLLKVAGEPNRLAALEAIGPGGEVGVRELAEALAVNPSALGHHTSVLKLAGLIEGGRKGAGSIYRLTGLGRKVLRFAQEL